MRPHSALPTLLVPLLLGCAAAPGARAAAKEAHPTGGAQEPQELGPIRFGDPEQLAYTEPFFPGATYDPDVVTPDAVLGQTHGTRLSHHAEVNECFRLWAETSERVTLHTYARSHEGRELVYAVIASPANQARIETIRANLARLADPRELSDAEGERLIAETPPVAWMAYSIHGDELSGTDAAVALGYHLTAGTSADVTDLLERIVVVIDPCQNPDGRERIISMVEQSAGYTPNIDYASMHRGRWPHGRGNHYLFDMNRDWMAGTQPETRGRWKAALRFNPQLFVDAHEMGSLDTFLFYPQAEPINPAVHSELTEWQGVFAAGAARAFDRYGWSYYTREWADGWAPFYSDAWSSLIGAVGILYEQAGTAGSSLRRASGEILTYREAVHHQAVASLANLRTLAERRDDVLASFLAGKRENVAAETPGEERVFVLPAGRNGFRERELLRTLLGQGIEVWRAGEAFTGANAEGAHGERAEEVAFEAGALIVPARQPQARLVRAYLSFDQRMDKEALQSEREELERKGSSKIYDVTAWSLAHALDLDAWWCDRFDVPSTRVDEPPPAPAGLLAAENPVAWLVDGADDGAVCFAAQAMELGLAVNFADEKFTSGGRSYARGSLLLRRAENPGDLEDLRGRIARASKRAGVNVFESGSGRSPDEGPDLGGGHFHLLARPRIAVLANSPVASDRYGHLWHHLDTVLGVPFTILDAQSFGHGDLRRYNVLVLPPGADSALRGAKEELETWVSSGGTLVACAGSAAELTSGRLGLASATLRRDAIEDLDPYYLAARRERTARAIEIDERLVWDGEPSEAAPDDVEGDGEEPAQKPQEGEAKDAGEEKEKEKEKELKEPPADRDAWMRTFSPYGVNLLSYPNPEQWITAGCGERLAAPFSGSQVLLTRDRAAVRLAPAAELRLGGLLWPEARERIAESAWLVVERKGDGQLILFAGMPAFRGYNHGSGRLFSNAVIYGPGLGADQPLGW